MGLSLAASFVRATEKGRRFWPWAWKQRRGDAVFFSLSFLFSLFLFLKDLLQSRVFERPAPTLSLVPTSHALSPDEGVMCSEGPLKATRLRASLGVPATGPDFAGHRGQPIDRICWTSSQFLGENTHCRAHIPLSLFTLLSPDFT